MHLATNLVPHALVITFYHILKDHTKEFSSIMKMLYFLRCILFWFFSFTDCKTCHNGCKYIEYPPSKPAYNHVSKICVFWILKYAEKTHSAISYKSCFHKAIYIV